MKHIIFPIALMALSSSAMAHPHKTQSEKDSAKSERSWSFFGNKAEEKAEDKAEEGAKGSDSLTAPEFANRLEARIEKHSRKLERNFEDAKSRNDFLSEGREINSPSDLRDAAEALEGLMAESGLISGLADMMLDLAEDFEIETSDEGLSLSFDGDRIGRVKMKRDRHTDSVLDIEGFGRNMTIEKEVIKRGGKTKTRIVIEVDGDEEFDIDFRPRSED